MRCLAEFLSNSYVQTIIAACRESRAVQRILVELHPVWLRAWRIGESFNPTDPAQGYKEAAREGVYARSRYLAYPLELTLLRPWLPLPFGLTRSRAKPRCPGSIIPASARCFQ